MALKGKIGSLGKLNLDDLYNTYLGLERKQQIAVIVAAVVSIFLILLLPVACVSSKLSEKKEAYQKEATMAAEFYQVLDDYAKLKERFEQLKQSESSVGGDPLKTVLYKVTDEMQIERQRVTPKTLSPVEGDMFIEIGKDVTIRNVRIDQAIKLLSQLIQNADFPVNIKKVSMQVDTKNKANIKVLSFSMTSLQMKEQKQTDEREEEPTKPRPRRKTGE